ncbi:MAG TPA: hypothetical protein VIH86_13840 [Puia sp.]
MEDLQIETDKEKYKNAIWESRDEVTVFHALISSPELIDKAIERLTTTIAEKYNLQVADINVNRDNPEQFYIWWVTEDGLRKQKSEILIYEVGEEIQLSVSVKN